MIPLIPYNVVLKSYTAQDEGYVTPEGETIIWRNIRGKTVPIKVDSTQYVDWLAKQGVQVDTSSQTAMQQAEAILENLQRVGESGGPAAQAQYEQQVVAQLQGYGQAAAGAGYEQALAQRAQQYGITPDELKDRYAQMYDEHKKANPKHKAGKRVSNDEQWDAFISHYSDDMLKRAKDSTVGSSEWGVSMATDLVMRVLQEQAKKGAVPGQINLRDIISNELKTRSGLKTNFAHYVEGITDDMHQSMAAISIVDGLTALAQNLDDDTEFGQAFESEVGKVYGKMSHDYIQASHAGKFRAGKGFMPTANLDSVPDELPDAFSSDEASALYNHYEKSGGGKLSNSHKVLTHAMGRLMDSIPADQHAKIAVALSDAKTGLHMVHKIAFNRSAEDNRDGNGYFDMDSTVENALRDAARAKDPASAERAIRRIAAAMGAIDGYSAVRNKPKAIGKELDGLWQNSAAAAGRKSVKGEGPNLMGYITNDTDRKGAFIPNKSLGIVHAPANNAVTPAQNTAAAKTQVSAAHAVSMPTIDMSFDENGVANAGKDPVDTYDFPGISDEDKQFFEGDAGEHIEGEWHRSNSNPKSYVTKDGFSVYYDKESGQNMLSTPDGKDMVINSMYGKNDDSKTRRSKGLSVATTMINAYRERFATKTGGTAPQKQVTTPEPQQTPVQAAIEEATNPVANVPEAPAERAAVSTTLKLDEGSMDTYSQIHEMLESKGFAITDLKKNAVQAKMGNTKIMFTSAGGKLLMGFKGKKIPVNTPDDFKNFLGESITSMPTTDTPSSPENHDELKSNLERLAGESGLDVSTGATGKTVVKSGDESLTLFKAKNGKVVLFHKDGTGTPEEIPFDDMEKTINSMKSRSALSVVPEETQPSPETTSAPEIPATEGERPDFSMDIGFDEPEQPDTTAQPETTDQPETTEPEASEEEVQPEREFKSHQEETFDNFAARISDPSVFNTIRDMKGVAMESTADGKMLTIGTYRSHEHKENRAVFTTDDNGKAYLKLTSPKGNQSVPIDGSLRQRLEQHFGMEESTPQTTEAPAQASTEPQGAVEASDLRNLGGAISGAAKGAHDAIYSAYKSGEVKEQGVTSPILQGAALLKKHRGLDMTPEQFKDFSNGFIKMEEETPRGSQGWQSAVRQYVNAFNPEGANSPETTQAPTAEAPAQASPRVASTGRFNFDSDTTPKGKPYGSHESIRERYTAHAEEALAKPKDIESLDALGTMSPDLKLRTNSGAIAARHEDGTTFVARPALKSDKGSITDNGEDFNDYYQIQDGEGNILHEGKFANLAKDISGKNAKARTQLAKFFPSAAQPEAPAKVKPLKGARKSAAERRADKQDQLKPGIKAISHDESMKRVEEFKANNPVRAKTPAKKEETTVAPTPEAPVTEKKEVPAAPSKKNKSPNSFHPDVHKNLIGHIESMNDKSDEEVAASLADKFPDDISPDIAEYYVHSVRRNNKQGKNFRNLADMSL